MRLTAYLLAVLRLKLDVTVKPPRTCYPADGQPSGAGFSPARTCDLARPHSILDADYGRRWGIIACRFTFKSYEVVKIALYHTLGDLPEPKGTHRFCG